MNAFSSVVVGYDSMVVQILAFMMVLVTVKLMMIDKEHLTNVSVPFL